VSRSLKRRFSQFSSSGMKSRWRRKSAAPNKPLIRAITQRPKRLYAVGDIHGCYGELRALMEYLTKELALSADDQLIFIGDYIDRGKGAKQVIDLLLEIKQRWSETVFLKGNHEAMLLDYLGFGGIGGDVYLANGGVETLLSYGLDPADGVGTEDVRAHLPASHLEFLRQLEISVELGEFIFVHAGFRPGVPLHSQNEDDCTWIRSDFVESQHEFGKTIVFGHTPFEEVVLHLPFKIGIDTGLVYGNTLTMVELVEGDVYQVDFGEENVRVSRLRDRLDGS
jgi:serine/threonine protein phosphatase 1